MTAEEALREIYLHCTGVDAAETEGISPEAILKVFQAMLETTSAMIKGGNKYGADADKAIEQMRRQRDAARTALTDLLNRYVELVNSGDCGNWDPELESSVMAARKALGQ